MKGLKPLLTTTVIRRGDIFRINNPKKTSGSVISKIRPCVIIQNDIANIHSPVTIVAMITSFKGKKLYPTNVFITSKETGLPEDSVVLCNQIQTVNKTILIRKVGEISYKKMQAVDMALLKSLDLDYT